MYANQHRHAVPKDSIIRVLASHFTSDEINAAKTILVTKYGEFILPDRKKNRRDSQNRSEKIKVCQDIIDCLFDIDDIESVTDLSLAEKVAEMEAKFKTYDDTLSEIKAQQLIFQQHPRPLMSEVLSRPAQGQKRTMLSRTMPNALGNQHPDNAQPNIQQPPPGVAASPSEPVPSDSGQQLAPTLEPHVHQSTGNDAVSSQPSSQAGAAPLSQSGPASPSHTRSTHPYPDHMSPAGIEGPFLTPPDQRRRAAKQSRRVEAQNRRETSQGGNNNNNNNKNNNINGHQRSHASRRPVMGRAGDAGLRAAPVPSRDFFVYRVHRDDDVPQLSSYISKQGISVRDIVKKNHDDSKFNSFKVSVPVHDADKIMSADFWPSGIYIRQWREARGAKRDGTPNELRDRTTQDNHRRGNESSLRFNA